MQGNAALVPCRCDHEAIGTISEESVELVRDHMAHRATLHQLQNALSTGTVVHSLPTAHAGISDHFSHAQASQRTVGTQLGFLCGEADALAGLFLCRDSEVQGCVSAGVDLAT